MLWITEINEVIEVKIHKVFAHRFSSSHEKNISENIENTKVSFCAENK